MVSCIYIIMWKEGRQSKALYHKLPLMKFKLGNLGIDAYILRYPASTVLPLHVDKIRGGGGKHWRLNLTLRGESHFRCSECIYRSKRLNIFRPDLYEHALIVLTKTYKFSLGFAKFNKKDESNIQFKRT